MHTSNKPLSAATCLLTAALGYRTAAQLPPTPAEPSAGAKPQLYVAQRTQDLGTVIEGDKATITWRLENRGSADLVIDRTVASCGCTVVQLADAEKTVPPGGSLALKAEFDSTARRDSQNKSVTVFSNDPAEPQLRLDFKAKVEMLFDIQPVGMVNLRAIRRGQAAPRAVDVFPGPGRKELVVRSVELPEDAPLAHQVEPYEDQHGKGQRIRFTVLESAPLGQLNAVARVKLAVDGIDREREIPIRGEVIADLTWLPKVLDATRQPSLPGKRLAPITISSPEKLPFKIVEAGAGGLFEVAVAPSGGEPATEYSVTLTLREDAPPGPFGTTLRVSTSSLDQPLVEVPVFGIVAAPVEVEPPVVLLRDDGTPAGSSRRVRMKAGVPSTALDISSIRCDNPAVTVAVDETASRKYQHIRFLDVRLSGKADPGRHTATLRVTTGVRGAEQLEIPVIVESDKKPG